MAALLLHTFWYVLNYMAVTRTCVCGCVCVYLWYAALVITWVCMCVCVCVCVCVWKLCTLQPFHILHGKTSSLVLIEQFFSSTFLLIFQIIIALGFQRYVPVFFTHFLHWPFFLYFYSIVDRNTRNAAY